MGGIEMQTNFQESNTWLLDSLQKQTNKPWKSEF